MSENRPHEIGEIELGGKKYPFNTPKIGPYLSALIRAKSVKGIENQGIIIGEAQAKWFEAGLGEESWKEIQKRLEDYKDVLDWEDLPEIFTDKIGEVSGPRPTTSSSDSPQASPATTPSVEKPKPPESIFGD